MIAIIIIIVVLAFLYFFIGGIIIKVTEKLAKKFNFFDGTLECDLFLILFWPIIFILLILLEFSEFGMFIAEKIFKSIDK